VSPAATDEPIEVPFDGSCAKHLTVEFYTVVYAANSHAYMLSFPSPSHFFILGLKPSFSANPFHRSLFFFSSGLTT